MKTPSIPPVPLASWEREAPRTTDNSERVSSSASTSLAPLDAAFLSRTFGTIAWFGLVFSGLVYAATASISAALSSVAGAVLGALLLKSQEIIVRRILRPKSAPAYEGWDRRIPLWVLLPVKYVLVTLAMGLGFHFHLLLPAFVGAGFIAVQFVLTAKVAGRILSGRVRSVREVYIEKLSHHG
jgi:hypothetical protein